jgi:hypothetical protein
MVNTKARIAIGALLATVVSLAISCSKSSGGNNNNTGSKPPPSDATHIYLYDTAFRNYLKAKICPDAFDASGRLDITNAEVTGFTGTMTIDSSTYKIQSVVGIAYFTKMTKLIIQNSLVDSLNLPTTMALDTIRLLSNPDMQVISVAGCTNMRYIRFSYIPAMSLDLSNLPELNTISGLSSGRLSTLKVDNDGNLQHILCYGLGALTGVNTATCPNLQRLFLEVCYGITSLDVSKNPKLYWLMTTYATGLKKVDLSSNPALAMVSFEQSGLDSVDFSHNPALFSVGLFFMPALKKLNVSANPKLCQLGLDGCGLLTTVDLRTQTSFNFYQLDFSKLNPGSTISDADMYELYPGGFISPTPSALYSLADSATRKSEGASMNLYGGLRLPMYLDGNGLSLTNVWVNDAIKNNYSLLMSRETGGFVPQPVVTVYAADRTTITCADYSPENETCN